MKNITILIFVGLILFSCVSEEVQRSASNISELYGADNAFIGYEKGFDSKTGSGKKIKLRLINPSKIQDDFSIDQVGSISAKILLDELTNDDFESVNQIEVVVSKKDKESNVTYNVDDIRSVDGDLGVVSTYFGFAENLQMDSINNVIDFSLKSYKSRFSIEQITYKIDSLFSKGLEYNFIGFKFDRTEWEDEPITIVWVEGKYEKALLNYTFYVRRSNNKLLALSIEEL